MKDPWEKAYLYGRSERGEVAHIATRRHWPFCQTTFLYLFNRTPKPYPVCKNCLKTKRAKELGL